MCRRKDAKRHGLETWNSSFTRQEVAEFLKFMYAKFKIEFDKFGAGWSSLDSKWQTCMREILVGTFVDDVIFICSCCA